MFTCGPAFFKVVNDSPLPPSPTTQLMDFGYRGKPFVVIAIGGADTSTMDYQLVAKPFFVQ